MIELSYSTMHALIHEPHTFICKYKLDLETFTTPALAEGSRLHRIIQDHVSGRATHPALAHLPYFPHVEQQAFDPTMKVRRPINDQFSFVGYVDRMNAQTQQFLEIKTGSVWSKQRFLDHVQWKLYAAALPHYAEVVFVNCSRPERSWTTRNVRVYRHTITAADRAAAEPFIALAIDIIAHIDQYPLYVRGRSRWCFYRGCPYCAGGGGGELGSVPC